MFRVLHRWAGVIAALVLVVVSLTGTILSVFPLLSADRAADRLNAGALVSAVRQSVEGVQQITVDTNGVVTAAAFGPDGFEQTLIDPVTGAALGPIQQNGVELWVEGLHRALFLGEGGHITVVVASAALLLLALSGLWLAKRRLGGWRKLLSRDRGAGAAGLHLKVARFAVAGLLLSSATGLWMGAATLGLIPDPAPAPARPASVGTGVPLPASEIEGLVSIPGATLRSIDLPRENVPGSAYLVETDAGAGYVDPATGELLSWDDRSGWSRVMDTVHLLHTGQGASLLGLVLGLLALSVPVLSGSGLLTWLGGRRRKVATARAETADVVLLVGSEGGSTWRFAEALALSLRQAGQSAHLAPMNGFAPERYHAAASVVVFAASYGEGDAPESARRFLDKLASSDSLPEASLSVLGFGDSTFPEFCGYAEAVVRAARAKGWAMLLAPHRVDRQSPEDFAAWGEAYARARGLDLGDVSTALERPAGRPLRLVSRQIHGEEAQAPTAVLRFALPRVSLLDRLLGRGFAGFEAGDLLNVLPEGEDRPRSYSLASQASDGFAEICVRRTPGGICSGQLHALQPGQTVTAFITRNARFHAPRDTAPLVLIGAGAGVGALAGMVRANLTGRPVHLYFGTRSRDGGLPFEADLCAWQEQGRLTDMTLALSRGAPPRYVQHALAADAQRLRELAARGARFMICGGGEMAAGVREVLNDLLWPVGTSVEALKEEGRYAVDVF